MLTTLMLQLSELEEYIENLSSSNNEIDKLYNVSQIESKISNLSLFFERQAEAKVLFESLRDNYIKTYLLK